MNVFQASGLPKRWMESQALSFALLSNFNRDQDRRRSNPTLTAYLDVHCVEEYERIVSLKRTLGPGLDLLVQVFC